MSQEKVQGRRDLVKQLVEEYHADAVLYEQLKFCDFWGYERTLAPLVNGEELGFPCISVDRDYVVRGSGQLMTRVQAFVESIEFKKLQKKKGGQ